VSEPDTYQTRRDVGGTALPFGKINLLHIMTDRERKFGLVENLITGLERDLFSQTILYLRGDPEVPNVLENSGYRVISCAVSKSTLKQFNWSLANTIADVIRERSIGIVHCQRHKATVYGAMAARRSGTSPSVVSTVHGRDRTRTLGRKLGNLFVLGRVARIIAVSEAVRQDVLKSNWLLKPEKVVTVYNGIDIRRFSNPAVSVSEARKRLGIPQDSPFVFGTVGRLMPVKGHDLLLKAFAEVISKQENAILVIAGEGPLDSELSGIAKRLSIGDRLRFLGYRADVPEILRALDAFVLPSRSEGLPVSLLEAMGSGLPVIATAVGGVPEILTHGETGILAPAGRVDKLAEAMLQLREMGAAGRTRMGRLAQQAVSERFTVQQMVAGTVGIYRKVMALSQKGPMRCAEEKSDFL
jgi:glycosyltransferase involved in cell wall biosynthesis